MALADKNNPPVCKILTDEEQMVIKNQLVPKFKRGSDPVMLCETEIIQSIASPPSTNNRNKSILEMPEHSLQHPGKYDYYY